MKIKYLGTAAAEGMPALFCHCKTCEYIRKNGGKDIRTRSQAVIDDTLLIDFPADTYMHTLQHCLPLHKIHHCIITHSHEDHLYPADFAMRAPGFASELGSDTEPLNIYGSRAVKRELAKTMTIYDLEQKNIVKYNLINPFKTYKIGEYEVVPLKANHDPIADPYIYIIKKDGKSLLYGNDTDIFPKATWDYLEKNPIKLDFVSLDCCNGAGPIDYDDAHMNFERNLVVKERLVKIGCADEKTIFCINHFSHNAKVVLYDELLKAVKDENFLVSYDGMEVEL